MDSSDDEVEDLPRFVSDYHFEDENREPISFASLPLQWDGEEAVDGEIREIFLSGFVDNGLRKIYKPVTAWKFNLSNAVPEILVLFKKTNWAMLQKPRKGFEKEIRSILVTIHCLYFAKKSPDTPEKFLWDQLAKTFSTYDVRPNQQDLVDHIPLIGEAVKKDEALGKSKFLLTFLEEKPQKRKELEKVIQTAVKPAFIVEDDDVMDDAEDESDEDDDLFATVCAFCDNGGDILCCDGRCMRSFHATTEAGDESECESLGFTTKQLKAIESFICPNCQYKQHQCFCCGKLGSSDKASGAEVFRCNSATCGLFYHPYCVATRLHEDNPTAIDEFTKKIAAGESFTCPIHKCHVCKGVEDKTDDGLQFAVCRRCPKSYHRKCLPREIVFEDTKDEGLVARAWEGLLPKRILIYCLDHQIDEDIGTPKRDHIRFPAIYENKKKQASELFCKAKLKKRYMNWEDSAQDLNSKTESKQIEKTSQALKKFDSIKKKEKNPYLPESFKRRKVSVKSRFGNMMSVSNKLEKLSEADESGPCLGDQLYELVCGGSTKTRRMSSPTSEKNVNTKRASSSFQLDEDSERSLLELIEESTSSITMDDILQKQKKKVPSTHSCCFKNALDKTFTQGKIEASVEAVQAALQKLEQGCSIEDAKAVCGPEILHQMTRWKNKLKVYLSPFLYGMRYTSFGRHFTKVEKLKEIVDKLHLYVQDGDMIVDFCCGANDFSCIMKRKLDETRKNCSYKNYDILQPKNDFNFEKKDWMTVQRHELPTGSRLIMGLNPPFGVKASLANQFIDKALEFKPKLLILIVPPETERLDKKLQPYDLVWEDCKKFSGKSFYLPGSVDAKDKQIEQWNTTPPVLSLWSHPDWTVKHSTIAQEHGHVSAGREESTLEENCSNVHSPGYLVEDNCNLGGDVTIPTDNCPMEIDNRGLNDSREFTTGGLKESSPCVTESVHEIDDHLKKQSKEKSAKRREDQDRHGKTAEKLSVSKESSPKNERGGHGFHGHMKNSSSQMSSKRGQGQDYCEHAVEKPCVHNDSSPSVNDREGHGIQCHKENQSKEKSLERRQSQDYWGKAVEWPSVREANRGMHHSVSPNATGARSSLEHHQSLSHEVPSHIRLEKEIYPNLSHSFSGYGRQFGGEYGGNVVNIPDGSVSHYQNPGTGTDFPWINGPIDDAGYRPYFRDNVRGSDISSQVQFNGNPGPEPFNWRGYAMTHDPEYGHDPAHGYSNFNPPSSYGYPSREATFGRMNTPAPTMQRYASQLDELNHARMSGRNGAVHDAQLPKFQMDSMGFAPASDGMFPRNGSSGWLE